MQSPFMQSVVDLTDVQNHLVGKSLEMLHLTDKNFVKGFFGILS